MLNDRLSMNPLQVVGVFNPALCHPRQSSVSQTTCFTPSASIDRHNDVGAPCAATPRLPLSGTLIWNLETCFVHRSPIYFLNK
jgi:hypothetical protein